MKQLSVTDITEYIRVVLKIAMKRGFSQLKLLNIKMIKNLIMENANMIA